MIQAQKIHNLLLKHPYYKKLPWENQLICINSALANFRKKTVDLFNSPLEQIYNLNRYYQPLSYEKLIKVDQLKDFTEEDIVILVNIALSNVHFRRSAKYQYSNISGFYEKEITYTLPLGKKAGIRLTPSTANTIITSLNGDKYSRYELAGEYIVSEEPNVSFQASLEAQYSFLETLELLFGLILSTKVESLLENVLAGFQLDLQPSVSLVPTFNKSFSLSTTVNTSYVQTISLTYKISLTNRGFAGTYQEQTDINFSPTLLVGYTVTST